MLQVAIFVDAGYLYAQGSTAIAGSKQPRAIIRLDVKSTIKKLKECALSAAPNTRLLRIYWYDGVERGGRLSQEQTKLATSPDVKLRLGLVNQKGEQKGVDSLIVTDILDLARNNAISDALVLSGDEDIRIGVQLAQSFGVRVHLLGIVPARGSQSLDLIQEADTHSEWLVHDVNEIMSLQQAAESGALRAGSDEGTALDLGSATDRAIEETIVDPKFDLIWVVGQLDVSKNRLPSVVDGPTLAKIRGLLGRELSEDERKAYRAKFVNELRSRANKS